jgi:hypothetical protein
VAVSVHGWNAFSKNPRFFCQFPFYDQHRKKSTLRPFPKLLAGIILDQKIVLLAVGEGEGNGGRSRIFDGEGSLKGGNGVCGTGDVIHFEGGHDSIVPDLISHRHSLAQEGFPPGSTTSRHEDNASKTTEKISWIHL